jgi:hypothetical protein
VEAFGVLIKFKMADIAMATKVQKLLNLFQAFYSLCFDLTRIQNHDLQL